MHCFHEPDDGDDDDGDGDDDHGDEDSDLRKQ